MIFGLCMEGVYIMYGGTMSMHDMITSLNYYIISWQWMTQLTTVLHEHFSVWKFHGCEPPDNFTAWHFHVLRLYIQGIMPVFLCFKIGYESFRQLYLDLSRQNRIWLPYWQFWCDTLSRFCLMIKECCS